MIVLNCEQGSREWVEARLGIPTASAFSRIVTPGGKLSAAREEYQGELLAEWALGEADEFGGTEWMERGKMLEPEALQHYAFYRDLQPERVGFVYRDEDQMVGCSPDGLVKDGALELKCPKASKHLIYLAGGQCPKKYVPQVQGHIWVTGRPWCDFMSYHPGLPPLIIRVEPDAAYQAAFDNHMPDFIDELLKGQDRLREMGVVPWNEQASEPGTVGEILDNLPPIESESQNDARRSD